MKQNLKDAMQSAGLATSIYALLRVGAFEGVIFWWMCIISLVLAITAAIEIVYPELLNK